jgi:hypothetical protein
MALCRSVVRIAGDRFIYLTGMHIAWPAIAFEE